MRILPIVAAVVLAVGACGGGAEEDPGVGNGEPAGTSAEDLTATMATSEREAGQVLDHLDDSGCAGEEGQQQVCGTILDRSSFVADTVIIVLDGVTDAPAEQAPKVADTRAAAQEVVDRHKQWDEATCATSTSAECRSQSQDLTAAVESLHKQLAEW